MTQVGWIGLGAMGRPMAARLLETGHEVTAYDIDPGAVSALGERAKGAASGAEAAAGSEVLAVMVATPAQVEDALFGDQGAVSALDEGSVVLVMATVGPTVVEGLTERLAERGVHVVDAPVSGGVARATTGDLLMMVSGPEPALDRVRPLLDAMASTAPVVGPAPGDGQKVKLVNQLLCGVHIAAAGEALGYAQALGLDPGVVYETIRHGAAGSFMFDDRGRRMVAREFEEARSALDIFVKDLGLVTAAAAAERFPATLASAANALFLMGSALGFGKEDDSGIVRVFEQWATRRPGA